MVNTLLMPNIKIYFEYKNKIIEAYSKSWIVKTNKSATIIRGQTLEGIKIAMFSSILIYFFILQINT